MASEQEYEAEEFAEVLENTVWEIVEHPKEGCLLLDIITNYLQAVDWKELAEAALEK